MILAAIPRPEAPKARVASAYSQIEQIWEEFDRERKQFLKNDAFPGEKTTFEMMASGWYNEYSYGSSSSLWYVHHSALHMKELVKDAESRVPHAQNYYRFLGPRVTDTAEKTWLIRKPALEEIFVEPTNMERVWLKLSPGGLYDAATQAWAGTDLNGIRDFFEVAREYRKQVVNHFHNEKVFASRQWFAGDKGTPDWDRLPQFVFQRADVDTNAKRALPYVCILFMINAVLFITISLIFVKSEV